MVSCPLLTPLTFLCAATPFGRAAKRGLRGLGSVRRADFGTLLCPEFTLRDLPRITVRGQTVQGVRLVLRKAPLRSSVDPWSTKRHCGPLAFRRATEGSRVLRKMRGSQEGDKKPFGVLSPFCPCRWAPTIPPPPGGGIPGRQTAANSPLPWERHPRRQTAASSQNPAAGSGSAQIPRVFFNFPCLQLTFPIFHGILNYRKQKEPMPASISSLINGIRHLVLPTPAGGKISPH